MGAPQNQRAPLAGPDVWLGKEMEARTDWIHVQKAPVRFRQNTKRALITLRSHFRIE